MNTDTTFFKDQLEQMIAASRQIIEKSEKLKAKAISEEKYINAEGYRVSISIHEDLIHKLTRVITGQPVFDLVRQKGGLACNG